MKKIQRREFLKSASVAAIAAGSGMTMLSGCSTEEKNKSTVINTGETFEWKMVTTWPPHFPLLGEFADNMAEWIGKISNGRLKIQVYGGGELIPALETFDAVSQGVAEMGHGAAYYWSGKVPAAQFFGSVPFGMNALQVNSWFYDGDGIKLWQELYEPFDLVPMPCGNTGGQMGGWFNKEIKSVSDIKGLKIRMPGLGGKIITKAGASSILSPGGELYTNLERGVIDALEWIGPYHDYLMGFNKIAKYYYYPGWHEPGSPLELIINKNAYESLPDDLKEIIKNAAAAINVMMLSGFEAKDTEYYFKLKEENTQFRKFPDEVIDVFRKLSKEVIDEITSSDPKAKKIYDSYSSFQKRISQWNDIAERNYSGL
ncbi:MAG TPA: TRAP transporter substrate-binding protein [Ignavibacteriaceae bacterium]|nr:TRAP transporter substrate-binding protein [Ignavibacteriaceae bacterium]